MATKSDLTVYLCQIQLDNTCIETTASPNTPLESNVSTVQTQVLDYLDSTPRHPLSALRPRSNNFPLLDRRTNLTTM